MTRRRTLPAITLFALWVLAACTPQSGGDAAGRTAPDGSPNITFFGDARLGVAVGPDPRTGKSRARLVAE